VEDFLRRQGRSVEWVELWSAPQDVASYDWRLDPSWETFGALVCEAARRAKALGRRVVLGGMSPVDPLWLERMLAWSGPELFDAVGVQGWPGTHDTPWTGWSAWMEPVRQVLARHGSRAELWITAAGYSTWRHDERRQVEEFLDAAAAPASRMYWDGLRDEARDVEAEAAPPDERDLHFGLKREDGGPKLLYRLWAESGLAGLAEHHRRLGTPRAARPREERRVVVFGGAGFIGCNVAHACLSEGQRVLVFDSLERPGVERNLRWLRETHGERVEVEVADVRDAQAVRRAVRHASEVFHFAAQVAVTTSLEAPEHDFEVNARGTLNVLEALRAEEEPAPLLFTSTNKVYGGLPGMRFVANGQRYEPLDPGIRAQGISERCGLDFESPYGCSKGAADHYVLDWARSYGLRAAVFRMSCIYGPRQFGTEDQGWVAHFLIRALKGEPMTLHGDGMQVRDLLFVEDLVRALRLAQQQMDKVSGQAFNIGGGPTRTVSLLELLALIEEHVGRRPEVRLEGWRTGDQRYYVSDTRKFQAATGWAPRVGVREGVALLHAWLKELLGGPLQRTVAVREPLETCAG
jgi:CDP-paratose 2-epimerase